FTFQSPLLPAARRICHRFVSWLFNLLPELPLWRQRASGPVAAYVAQRSHADETVLNFLIAVMFVHGEHLAAIGAAVFNLHPACLLKHQSNRPLTKIRRAVGRCLETGHRETASVTVSAPARLRKRWTLIL